MGCAYGDKDEQERLIKACSLDWTIAQPGVLTNGRRPKRYNILDDASQGRNGTSPIFWSDRSRIVLSFARRPRWFTEIYAPGGLCAG
jgi:NAD(P)H-binding